MRRTVLLTICILLFVVLLYLANNHESEKILYAASGMPLLIVWFLPDLKSGKIMDLRKYKKQAQVVRAIDPLRKTDQLIIAFQPNFMRWGKKTVYVPITKLKTQSLNESPEAISSLTVKREDLTLIGKRKDIIALQLPSLLKREQRSAASLTKVNRLIIQAEDIRSTLLSSSTGPQAKAKIELNA